MHPIQAGPNCCSTPASRWIPTALVPREHELLPRTRIHQLGPSSTFQT